MTNRDRMLAMYDAWNRHEMAESGKDWDEHIVFDTRGLGVIGVEGVYFGAQVVEYWRDWLPQWSDIQSNVRWIEENGHRVVAWLSQTQTGRESGITMTTEYAWDTMWRDGKLIRVSFTMDEAEARRAAGLL